VWAPEADLGRRPVARDSRPADPKLGWARTPRLAAQAWRRSRASTRGRPYEAEVCTDGRRKARTPRSKGRGCVVCTDVDPRARSSCSAPRPGSPKSRHTTPARSARSRGVPEKEGKEASRRRRNHSGDRKINGMREEAGNRLKADATARTRTTETAAVTASTRRGSSPARTGAPGAGVVEGSK